MTEGVSRKFKVLSFVFTVVIVLYHANNVFTTHYVLQGEANARLNIFFECAASMAMSYFFMTSGFLLYRDAGRENAAKKIKRRCISLLLPLFVWSCIYFAKEILTAHNGGDMDLRITTILYNFTFRPYDGPLWYNFAIFLLCLLIVPVTAVRGKQHVIPVCAICVCAVSLLVYGFGLLGWFGISEEFDLAAWTVRLCRYIPSYVLGCLLGIYKNQLIEFRLTPGYRWMTAAGAAAVLFAACALPDLRWLRLMIVTIAPVLIWLSVPNPGTGNALKWIRVSFLMYAAHMMVISVVFMLADRFFQREMGTAGLMYWVLFLLAVALCTYLMCCIIAYVLDRFNLKTLKIMLTGDRL